MEVRIYTVGHSNHETSYFGELLETVGITCVVDVRTIPASTYNPQFNRAALSAFLKNRQIAYLHLPEEFGARHDHPELLDDFGRVDFEKVHQSAAFQSGVNRLLKGLERNFVIALMCSEADPLDCHRFAMIARYLTENGFEVYHILRDKTILSNAALEDELLKKYRKKIPQPTLFDPDIPRNRQLDAAYRLRNQDIGWKTTETDAPNEAI
ncbi:DUF488 domain-containing protein [Larkinella sp. GY13]|uniref:DUF488 domain-containing protein n=1 Tax=Larkinella sp. GY13 TaxID=3453720 RepID=UPI003EEB06F2